jgi:hypothetical protein
VDSNIEAGLVHEMSRISLKARQLTLKRYPDIEIVENGRVTYLEVKTTSVKEDSDLRSFYYSNGKNLPPMQDIYCCQFP